MRAEPKRKNHTIGAKWLRQGGPFPDTTPVTGGSEEGGVSGAVIIANEIHNPNKSGKTKQVVREVSQGLEGEN